MVKRQYVFGVGIAVFAAAMLGVGAPVASAKEVAPGVSCSADLCDNDTDEVYRVTGYGYCDGELNALTQSLQPHSTERITCLGGDAVEGFSANGAFVSNFPG
ncbi:hypothetical protein ACWEO2_32005 [Nocardia sp. NPDC004278]